MTFVHEQLRDGSWVPPWLRYQNQARYEWAATFGKGLRVAEVGCGGGHGTVQLSAAGATHVDGFDLDAAAIANAQSTYGNDRLAFHVANAEGIPVEDESYDLVVSLETIEHVEDDEAYVREVARIVKSGGTLICTTPNRLLTNPGKSIVDQPFNKHHIREYTVAELRERLSPCFSSIEMLGQATYGAGYSRRLRAVGRMLPPLAVKLHQARKMLGIPWENIERHRPNTLIPQRVPEVLVAVCRK